jgi:hypothetical protein
MAQRDWSDGSLQQQLHNIGDDVIHLEGEEVGVLEYGPNKTEVIGKTEGEDLGDCEECLAYYLLPYLACRLMTGLTRTQDLLDACLFGEDAREGDEGDEGGRPGRAHPEARCVRRCGRCFGPRPGSAVRTHCAGVRAYCVNGLRIFRDSAIKAYNRWPLFVIFLVTSLILFLGYMLFLRVPQPADGDQRGLVDAVNGVLLWAGALLFSASVLASCSCFYLLYESSNIYGREASVRALRAFAPEDEGERFPRPGEDRAREDALDWTEGEGGQGRGGTEGREDLRAGF